MNTVNLSVTRAQFGENDKRLYEKPVGTLEHLENPVTPAEAWMQGLLVSCTTPKEFVTRLEEHAPHRVQREHLLAQMRNDGQRLKAVHGLSSAQVRDQKALFVARWVDRMHALVGIPRPWMRAWMKALGMIDKKGHLVVEFGGDP